MGQLIDVVYPIQLLYLYLHLFFLQILLLQFSDDLSEPLLESHNYNYKYK